MGKRGGLCGDFDLVWLVGKQGGNFGLNEESVGWEDLGERK